MPTFTPLDSPWMKANAKMPRTERCSKGERCDRDRVNMPEALTASDLEKLTLCDAHRASLYAERR